MDCCLLLTFPVYAMILTDIFIYTMQMILISSISLNGDLVKYQAENQYGFGFWGYINGVERTP